MVVKQKAFIFDIDGTLADNSHRQQYVRNKPKNWVAYNRTMIDDIPITAVVALLRILDGADVDIIICSGREEIYRETTEAWFNLHAIHGTYNRLMMRGKQDYRDDTIVKEEMLLELQKEYDIVAVFDDRHKVVDMWRKHGIYVFDCNQTREVF